MARISYNVAGDAPVGETRTNTVTAVMTFPYDPMPDLDLGSKTHSVQNDAATVLLEQALRHMAATGTDPRGAMGLAALLLGVGTLFLLSTRGKRKQEKVV